ncbi:KRAB domain-containing zinc finger protein [Sarotherodon galilaeus]
MCEICVVLVMTPAYLAHSQTIYASKNPVAVGSSVTLSSNVTSGGWLFNGHLIVITLNKTYDISSTWKDRVTFNTNTSSLTINPVTLKDSGSYVLENLVDGSFSQLTLLVEEPVSNVTVQTNTINLVEFNGTAVLMCSVSKGTSPSYQWFSGSSVITANEHLQLSSGNTILTIMNVTRNDQGPYRCYVSNNVSNNISAPVNLNISYGPSNAKMTVMPVSSIYKGGSNITLSCSADSSPPAMITWMIDGVYQKSTPSIQLQDVTESDSGNYTCLIQNTVTLRFSSKTTAIQIVDVTRSQTIYASENPVAVGNNVTLSSNYTVTSGGWLFNTRQIVIKLNEYFAISKTWKDRVLFNPSTSSLTILSVKLEDSGNYILQDVLNEFFSQLTLSVEESVYNVTIQTSTTNLVEFNDTAVLMCSVSKGTSLSYQWFNGSSMITANEKVQLSNGKTILTIMNVTRYDQGPYKCNVSNNVSNNISAPVNLNINYGPSNTEMTVMPLMNIYKGGSNITLSCSAVSSPPAIFQWMVNGVYLNKIGPMLQLEKVNKSMSGNYTCLIHNNVTFRFSSQTATIQIVDPVTAVVVKLINPAIFGETFSLSCEVTGPVDIIHWWRNYQLISADNKTKFGTDNRTLTISSTQRSDGGDYQCGAFNSVSNQTSLRFTVTVYYGPETPFVYGPAFAETGHQAVFSCSAESVPPSTFYWWFNGSIVANTSNYTTDVLSLSMSGEYRCMAINNVTGKNSTKSTTLKVIDPIQNVKLNGPVTSVKEGYAYNLTCNVTGPADYIYWMKNGQRLHEDNRTFFHKDNQTVEINPVKRYDTGNYYCLAINAAGNMSSALYMLVVIYGPEKPIIYGPAFAETGRQAVFSCSAMSVPPSQFFWWFNRSIVSNTSVYTTSLLSFNMSGVYTCMAINNVTGKNSTNSTTLTVVEAIQSVMIKNKTIPIDTKNFTLTCEVVGPYDTIYWMKDNMMLNMDPSNNSYVSYATENNMLHFTPVTLDSDGTYQCVATNKAGDHVSPQYRLLVNYGPLGLTISHASMFMYVSLTCQADSRPACDFSWFFNNQSTPLQNTPSIIFPATSQNFGIYTCKAWNSVTNITMYQNLNVTVPLKRMHWSFFKNNTYNVRGYGSLRLSSLCLVYDSFLNRIFQLGFECS